jgi:hypothetical protein
MSLDEDWTKWSAEFKVDPSRCTLIGSVMCAPESELLASLDDPGDDDCDHGTTYRLFCGRRIDITCVDDVVYMICPLVVSEALEDYLCLSDILSAVVCIEHGTIVREVGPGLLLQSKTGSGIYETKTEFVLTSHGVHVVRIGCSYFNWDYDVAGPVINLIETKSDCQKQGFGTLAIRLVEEWMCRELSTLSIVVRMSISEPVAPEFFDKLGYKRLAYDQDERGDRFKKLFPSRQVEMNKTSSHGVRVNVPSS